MRLWGIAIAVALAACAQSSSVQCSDGRTCPVGSLCDDINHLCISPEQLAVCEGKGELEACTVNEQPGVCVGGACVPQFCGDGRVTGAEECDGEDLGATPNCIDLGYYYDVAMSCRADCTYDEEDVCYGVCGDGVRDFTAAGEYCDLTLAAGNTDSCVTFGYEAGTLGCSTACTPGFASCARLVPHLESSASDPTAMWGTAPDDIFAVNTASGTAPRLHHFDGVGWQPMGLPATLDPTVDLLAVWGASPTDVYAVGHQIHDPDGSKLPGTVLHYDGTTWSEQTIPSDTLPTDVWIGGGTGYVVGIKPGGQGVVLKLSGTTWSAITSPTTSVLRSVWGAGANDVFAGGDGGVWRWNGSAWQAFGMPISVNALWGFGPNDVYAVGGSFSNGYAYGAAYHFDGNTWTKIPTPTCMGDLFDVWGSSPTDIYVGAGGGTKSRSIYHYDGVSWTGLASPTQSRSRAFWGFPNQPDDVLFGAFQIYRLGGATFAMSNPYEPQPSGFDCAVNAPPATTCEQSEMQAIAGRSASDVYSFGDESDLNGVGRICHYDGTQWSQVYLDVKNGVSNAWVSATGRVFAAGTRAFGSDGCGEVRRATLLTAASPAGPWDAFPTTLTGNTRFTDVWGASDTNVFVTANRNPCGGAVSGHIFRWNGAQWTEMSIPAQLGVNRVWGTSASNVYAFTTGGGVLHYNGNAQNEWTAIAKPATFCPVLSDMTGSGTSLFVLCFGQVFRLDTTAATPSWVELGNHGGAFGVRVTVLPLGAEDVFVFGGNANGDSVIKHYDRVGTELQPNPVEYDGGPIVDAWGTAKRIFWVDDTGVHSLVRTVPW